jgi:hypothetical protein
MAKEKDEPQANKQRLESREQQRSEKKYSVLKLDTTKNFQ